MQRFTAQLKQLTTLFTKLQSKCWISFFNTMPRNWHCGMVGEVVAWKAVEDGLSAWAPATRVGDQEEAPSFSPAHPL